ncbi:MAG TPA: cupin domain-containing protein [Solirubrobacteraceae bacterium]|nr:cupin domain-containing protein [Solirubrobacteraceae bacterium]
MKIAKLNESPTRDVAVGHIKGTWRDLGREAGSRTVGLRRIEVAEGFFSTPAHEHGADEEIFFVLGGEGLLWQDGETYAITPGDCIVHRPKRGPHTLRGGAGGLDVLVFGQRRDASLTALPRAGVAWSFPRWVELGGGDNPFAREAAAGAPECPEPKAERPGNIVSLDAVPAILDGRARRAGAAAGAVATGLNHVVLSAEQQGAPAHCHSMEEELFVVLDGAGVLELWGRGERSPEDHPLTSGDVVSRPAGSGVAHAIRPGGKGITYLAYGTREPSDMCFYPQSGRVSLRGLGIALRSPEIDFLPGI